jgi:hypothetical protein
MEETDEINTQENDTGPRRNSIAGPAGTGIGEYGPRFNKTRE